jgi:hypothetical protein
MDFAAEGVYLLASSIIHMPNSKATGMVTVLATTILLGSQVLWVRNSDMTSWECPIYTFTRKTDMAGEWNLLEFLCSHVC